MPEERQKPLKDRATREWLLKNKVPAGLYEYLIARTAYFDLIFEKALQENIPQIVFLGAGYDSRPYRFQDRINSTKIFEPDAKPTQERKLALLKQSEINIPENVILIPINFNSDSLEIVLSKVGYNREQRTLFICEGVTFYLSKIAVDQTLKSIIDISTIQSEICFDFLTYAGTPKEKYILKTETPGEVIQFGIPEGEIEKFLAKRGFRVIEHCGSKELEKRFLTLKDGSLIGNVKPIMNIVHASVRKKIIVN